MRSLSALVLVALAAPAFAAATHSVPWRPQPWHPPVAALAAGVRSDPDVPGSPGLDLGAAIAAERAALKATPVLRHADGSHYAVVGGRARRWIVARVGDDGSLTQGCVPTAAQARAFVTAPAPKER